MRSSESPPLGPLLGLPAPFDMAPLWRLLAGLLLCLFPSPRPLSALLPAGCRANLGADGEASLQNGLDLARAALAPIPAYGHREVRPPRMPAYPGRPRHPALRPAQPLPSAGLFRGSAVLPPSCLPFQPGCFHPSLPLSFLAP